jgi:hypothetical protein
MLAVENNSELFADAALPEPSLLEIQRSKISFRPAKEGYDYRIIRLPHVFAVRRATDACLSSSAQW